MTFAGRDAYLAAGLMTEAKPEEIIEFPQEGTGGCASHSLVSGTPEKSYPFNLVKWYR